MNPLVSVIIPTKNSAHTIKACLTSITNQSYKHIECIVVDNHSHDATREIAKKYHAQVFIAGNERSAQRNFGAARSRGNFLLFIDSDMELHSNVVQECVQKISAQGAYQAIVIPEESFGSTLWARCKQFERSCYANTPWLHAARFFKKEAFSVIGGFHEHMVAGEDFDIHLRTIHQFTAASITHISAKILHNEGNLRLRALLRKKYFYGSKISLYKNQAKSQQAFLMQANPIARTALFFQSPKTILLHPILFGATCMMKWLEFGALALGYIKHIALY